MTALPARLHSGSGADDARAVLGAALRGSTKSAGVHRRVDPPRGRRARRRSRGRGFQRRQRHAADHRGRAGQAAGSEERGVLSSVSEGYAAALGLRVVKGRWLTDHEQCAGVRDQRDAGAAGVCRDRSDWQTNPRPLHRPRSPDPMHPHVLAKSSASSRISAIPSWVWRRSRNCSWTMLHARMGGTTLTIRTSADPMSVAPSLRTVLSSVGSRAAAVRCEAARRRARRFDRPAPLDPAPARHIRGRGAAPRHRRHLRPRSRMPSRSGHRRLVSASRSGPPPRQVVMMVVAQGMAITNRWNRRLGSRTAILSTRLMTALLYEVTPTDLRHVRGGQPSPFSARRSRRAVLQPSGPPSSTRSSHFVANDERARDLTAPPGISTAG